MFLRGIHHFPNNLIGSRQLFEVVFNFIAIVRSLSSAILNIDQRKEKSKLLSAIVAEGTYIRRSGDKEEQQESLLGEESDGFCSLSPMQRLYGFAGCLIAGLVCMLVSIAVFAKPVKFAVLFTVGNLLAIGSTAFLLGPVQQFEMMFDPVRVVATAIYLGCVVIALVCALLFHSKVLTIIAIICEICALIWYSLSYIPFARRMVSELMVRLCDTEL